jgi:hypothetical protein
MKGQAVPSHRRRKDKKVESNTIKPLKQQKQLMTGITTYLPILTLNVNVLNSPIKRNHLANWIEKGRCNSLLLTGDPSH